MRDLIEKIVDGNDNLFEQLIKQLAGSKLFVFAQPEDEEGLTLNFLNYALEDNHDIEYIPIFTDEDEVETFTDEADVPEGYLLYEFEGELFAELMDGEQYIMINPMTGGIVFQGAHLKVFATVANDDQVQP